MEIKLLTNVKVIKMALRYLRDSIGIDLLSSDVDNNKFLDSLFYNDSFTNFLSIVTGIEVERLDEMELKEQIDIFNKFNETLKKSLSMEALS